MIAYVDSSVVLRVVLGQRDRLNEWGSIVSGISSGLIEVECLRTIDRFRLATGQPDDQTASQREAVYRVLEAVEMIEPTATILRRAAQPLPTPLGTLDAIHLATAAMWREARGKELTVATHDRALGLAARASGFRVVGV